MGQGKVPTMAFGIAMFEPDMLTPMSPDLLRRHDRLVGSWGVKGQEAMAAELKKKYKEPWVTQNVMSTYADYIVIRDALNKAGKADREAVATALRTMDGGPSKYYPGGEIKFDAKGRRVGAGLAVIQWQNGVPLTIYPDGTRNGQADLVEEVTRSGGAGHALAPPHPFPSGQRLHRRESRAMSSSRVSRTILARALSRARQRRCRARHHRRLVHHHIHIGVRIAALRARRRARPHRRNRAVAAARSALEFGFAAPVELWKRFLSPNPPPLYHDFFAMLMRVPEFTLEGDSFGAMQNARALHRMMNIMRETGAPDA